MSSILIVDDEPASRALLREILVTQSYTVIETEDGQQALDILAQQKVDLVITDRSMPVMDGMELLKTLSRSRPQLPVIVVSGFGEESLWGQAVGLGAKDYFLKPYKAADVIKVVKRCLLGGSST